MEIEMHSRVLRRHLLTMTMLTQRAVDFAIKAYELGSPELCRLVCESERQWIQLQRRIGDRGRTLIASGRPVYSDSVFDCCALRIYGALHVMYTAAKEIAQNSMHIIECGWQTDSAEVREMGNFVNSMVRLCAVAVFKKETQHVETILKRDPSQQWFDLAPYRAHISRVERTDSQARFELAIIKCLVQIAEQAHEMAEAMTSWSEGKECLGVTRERAA